MTSSSASNRCCDGCARPFTSRRRVVRNEGIRAYCTACYRRMFEHRPCGTCPGTAIVLRRLIGPAECAACERTSRRCVRCEAAVPLAGLRVVDGVVCPSCARYYRTQAICPRCEHPAPYLSLAPSLGVTEPICDKCRARLTHRTCDRCRRYRPVMGRTAEGNALCASCLPGSEVSHPCPVCREPVEGTGTGLCLLCLQRSQIRRAVDDPNHQMHHPWVQEALECFAVWLMEREQGNYGLMRRFQHALGFFRFLDLTYPERSLLTGEELLGTLGTRGMRRHLLVTRFLEESGYVRIDAERRAEEAECTYIAEKLADNQVAPWGPLLERYVTWMELQRIAPRTRRLYLRAAEKWCRYARLDGSRAWASDLLVQFFKRSSGSRASLSRFLRFARDELGWEVVLPPRNEATRSRYPQTVDALQALQDRIQDAGGAASAATSDLVRLLAKAFGLSVRAFQQEEWRLERANEVLSLVGTSENEVVPSELVEVVQTWWDRQTSASAEQVLSADIGGALPTDAGGTAPTRDAETSSPNPAATT